MLYGASLMLEFVTLVALRVREPELKREFRVPGGLTGAIACGIFPLLLLILATVESGNEVVLGMNGLAFGALITVAGLDRKSTRLNSSHGYISYAVFCLKKKKKKT